MRFTPAARRRACRCLEEYGWRKAPSSRSALPMRMSVSSGIWSTVNLSASAWSMAPLMISWNQQIKWDTGCRDKQCKLMQTLNALTLCFKAWSRSALSLSLSLSLRLCRCSSACCASVYLWRALCRCIMPSVAPPWLGTLVKPWQRGKLNTVTWSNLTLFCVPASLGLLRMGRTGKDRTNLKCRVSIWCRSITTYSGNNLFWVHFYQDSPSLKLFLRGQNNQWCFSGSTFRMWLKVHVLRNRQTTAVERGLITTAKISFKSFIYFKNCLDLIFRSSFQIVVFYFLTSSDMTEIILTRWWHKTYKRSKVISKRFNVLSLSLTLENDL